MVADLMDFLPRTTEYIKVDNQQSVDGKDLSLSYQRQQDQHGALLAALPVIRENLVVRYHIKR